MSNKECVLNIVNNMIDDLIESKKAPFLLIDNDFFKEIKNCLNELIAEKKLGYGKGINRLYIINQKCIKKQKEIES